MKKCCFIFFAVCTLLLSSCILSRKVVYVEDMAPGKKYIATEAPALRVHKRDRLGIVITAKLPELAVPFNQGIGNYQVNAQGDVIAGPATTMATKGYLVDDYGEIDFPVLGALRVEGLTLDEVKEMIRRRLEDGQLINDPIVQVDLLNLKINMMGEINSVGVLNVPDGRISLLEAISRAGGLTNNAAVDKITVIREEEGERVTIVNDIRSRDIFDSPTYYLQQNDIVYILPKDAVATPKVENSWRFIGMGMGLIATVFTILTFMK